MELLDDFEQASIPSFPKIERKTYYLYGACLFAVIIGTFLAINLKLWKPFPLFVNTAGWVFMGAIFVVTALFYQKLILHPVGLLLSSIVAFVGCGLLSVFLLTILDFYPRYHLTAGVFLWFLYYLSSLCLFQVLYAILKKRHERNH